TRSTSSSSRADSVSASSRSDASLLRLQLCAAFVDAAIPQQVAAVGGGRAGFVFVRAAVVGRRDADERRRGRGSVVRAAEALAALHAGGALLAVRAARRERGERSHIARSELLARQKERWMAGIGLAVEIDVERRDPDLLARARRRSSERLIGER